MRKLLYIFIALSLFGVSNSVYAQPTWCVPVNSAGEFVSTGDCGTFHVPTGTIGTQSNDWYAVIWNSSPPPNPNWGGTSEVNGANNGYHTFAQWEGINALGGIEFFFGSYPSTGYKSIGFTSCRSWNGSSCTSYGYPTSDADLGYAEWYFDGTNWTSIAPPPDDISTRIVSISPENGSTTDSYIEIEGDFYNQSELYNRLLVNLSWVEPSVNTNLLLSDVAYRQFVFNIATSSSIQSFATTTSGLITGRWLLEAQFSNNTTGFEYFTATSTSFVVGTTTTFYSDFVDYATTTPYGEPIEDCANADGVLEKAICALGDRIKSVFEYLLIPSDTTFNRFTQLKDNILAKAPFGYFPLFKEALGGISASSTPIFSMVIPLSQVPRFSDIRTGLAWVLLFWFVVHMWRRFKHIQL